MGRPSRYPCRALSRLTTDLSIRSYSEGDFGAVDALWQACNLTRSWNDPARDIDFCQKSPASGLFVGEIESKVIATVMSGHDGHRGVIYFLAVHPDHQGKDLGRTMVRYAENWLQDLGVWKVNLMIRGDNEAVREFYKTLGYEEEPRIVMSRRLVKQSE